MNVTILATNGQIAHPVEERLLTEPTFKDIQLTLMLRLNPDAPSSGTTF